MITVAEALDRVLSLFEPLEHEIVPLAATCGRVLAQPVTANRSQPPFAASAMDGYALMGVEAEPDAMFKVIGESAAGHGFDGVVKAGQAVRIFTGAPLPAGATRVIIQEDVNRSGDVITLKRDLDQKDYIRPAGADFSKGDTIKAPRLISPSDVALFASMNLPAVPVTRRPVVALIATGDELVMPGDIPNQDQIIASNSFGLKALFEHHGAEVRMLPIASDTEGSLRTAFELTKGADLIVTIGGASVGDHDLVGKVAANLGMERAFYKVAMRPGKPLMAGKLTGTPMVGLPGNSVSSMVCGHIFILPALRKLQGLPERPAALRTAELAEPLGQNGPREHYMRAKVSNDKITAFARQDSALLTVLSDANALLIRSPHDPAKEAGMTVKYLLL